MTDAQCSITVSRLVAAPAAVVFAFLAEPARHSAFDTSGMVRRAVTVGRLTGMGEVFVMEMHNAIRGDHRVDCHVVEYELGRALGWAPAEPGRPPAGHTWTWRLRPEGSNRTWVSQTYDWSAFTHADHLDQLPVVGREGLRASLDLLAAAVEDA
ncbi:SRPBCC family protein [Tenggerimyces flavus]|uniref:SRPBCC family protein n=1 Tax=Tenggerimyces flavus TaxID=1708749 RepID=A0ABV7YGX2_9ACTN|nr:SRPBCC family protein [Tenggerimyces flavus]MBM7790302.1 uncharacterized protein YndB with AHSA1/START domain [Tenggerimyces flavus]